MPPAKILVIEDEPAIADTIKYALSTDGLDPLWCATGSQGLAVFAAEPIALVVLDVGLPDINGFELFKQLRAIKDVPTIFLTARGDEIDRVVGLELGADDYISKPFSPRELSARIRNMLRRIQPIPNPLLAPTSSTRMPFVVDDTKMRIFYCGKELELSRYEYRLLKLFVERPGRVFSRDQLMNLVWDEPDSSLERTVDAHIKQLRAKLRQISEAHETILTHRGVGYSMNDKW